MISSHEAEAAVDFIRDNAKKLGHAKSNRIYLEEFRKSKRAMLVQEIQGTIQERDAFAYSHKDYIEILNALKEAVYEEERLRWLMVSAQEKVSLYKTEEASNRLIDKVVR